MARLGVEIFPVERVIHPSLRHNNNRGERVPLRKTSHVTKTHKRRKPLEGLTPDAIIQEMKKAASVKRKINVRTMRGSPDRSDDKVLSETREGGTDPHGKGGIFGTAPRAGDQGPAVSDPQRTSDLPATQLSRVLKRMLGETPPPALLEVDGVGRVATNAEALAAVIQREAFAGRQWAVEMWRDQTEGKPVRAAQLNNNEQEVEDQLDRVSTAALNRLAEKG